MKILGFHAFGRQFWSSALIVALSLQRVKLQVRKEPTPQLSHPLPALEPSWALLGICTLGQRDPTGRELCPTKPSCVHTEECCEKEHTEKHSPEGNCAEAHEEVDEDCKKSKEVCVIQGGIAIEGPGLIQVLLRRCPLLCAHTHHSPFAQSRCVGAPGHWAPHYSQYGPFCPRNSSSRGPKGSPKIRLHFFSPS